MGSCIYSTHSRNVSLLAISVSITVPRPARGCPASKLSTPCIGLNGLSKSSYDIDKRCRV